MKLTIEELTATQVKIRKLNDRAAKRGWTGRITVEYEPVTETTTNTNGFQVTQTWMETTITGEPPCYEGWTFLAILDWHSASDLIIRSAPGVEVTDRTGLVEDQCDHCHTVRYRKDIYLVANTETGERMQVGSTCIKDFLGWDFRPVFISTEEASFDEGFGCGGGGGLPEFDPKTVLAASWACIQVFGYHKADEPGATKEAVMDLLYPNPRSQRAREFVTKLQPYFDKSYEQAQIILDWILSDDFGGHGDYVANLKIIAKGETVGPRNIGILASAPLSWARATERELRHRAERAEVRNEYFGKKGDRVTLTVQVKSIREFDGNYGVTTLYTMVTRHNFIVKWFASHATLGETANDTWYVIRGTIKGHEEYQGTKSTMLTRCKVLADSTDADSPEPEAPEEPDFKTWCDNYFSHAREFGNEPTEAAIEYAKPVYEDGKDRRAQMFKVQHRDWTERRHNWLEYGAGVR